MTVGTFACCDHHQPPLPRAATTSAIPANNADLGFCGGADEADADWLVLCVTGLGLRGVAATGAIISVSSAVGSWLTSGATGMVIGLGVTGWRGVSGAGVVAAVGTNITVSSTASAEIWICAAGGRDGDDTSGTECGLATVVGSRSRVWSNAAACFGTGSGISSGAGAGRTCGGMGIPAGASK